ncbi:MAG: Maf family protein [Verrucomicrobiota bacterium]
MKTSEKFLKMQEKEEFILASASPRRKALLEEAGLVFCMETSDIDEVNGGEGMNPKEIVLLNAQRKAYAVSARHAGKNILSADTMVVCDGKIIGKPADLNEAKSILNHLSGKMHEVLTAVVWLAPKKQASFKEIACTKVFFLRLTDHLIEDYLNKVNVLDKAGAYALQEHGEMLIEKIEGSLTNVIGLPMEIVGKFLKIELPSSYNS